MAFNLLKTYNDLLELSSFNEVERKKSLWGVFHINFIQNSHIIFNGKLVTPTPSDGVLDMKVLFSHLTTEEVDPKTKRREFDIYRSIRLHWVRYHLDFKKESVLVFSVREGRGLRTYIYDEEERYVVILEPKINYNTYYLLSAYYVRGTPYKSDSIIKKFGRRLDHIL